MVKGAGVKAVKIGTNKKTKLKKTTTRLRRIKSPVKKGLIGKKPTILKKTGELVLDEIGEVTHYFQHVNAAAVKLTKSGLKVGDVIYLKGHTTDFKETVRSIQLDRSPLTQGKKGQEIGLYVKSRVRIGDKVYKI